MNEELLVEETEQEEPTFPEIMEITPDVKGDIADIMMGRCPPTVTNS